MKLYNSVGPNPRVVRMFAAEKGIDLPKQDVDIRAGDNRLEPYLKVNPAGPRPAPELDNGTTLTETTATCEYPEAKTPDPPLLARTPDERAETRMWTPHADLTIVAPLPSGFRPSEGPHTF